MKKLISATAVAALTLSLGSLAFAQSNSNAAGDAGAKTNSMKMDAKKMMGSSDTVKIAPQNNSDESGTATLMQAGPNVVVKVALTGAGATGTQPAHIHTGSCSTLGGVKYPLTSLTDGKSTTTIKNVKLSSLTGGGYAINVHKSPSDLADYTACGDIKAGSMSGM